MLTRRAPMQRAAFKRKDAPPPRPGKQIAYVARPRQEVRYPLSRDGQSAGTFAVEVDLATGALLSPTFSQQGGAIPGIAHLIVLEADEA